MGILTSLVQGAVSTQQEYQVVLYPLLLLTQQPGKVNGETERYI